MKVVYLISAFFAYTAVFLESFAFVVLCLIAGFATDMTTSGAGVAPMTLFIIETFFGSDLAQSTAKNWAMISSSIFAFLLVGSLYTASRNGQAFKAIMLAIASFAISFLGITKGMFNCFPHEACWTIHDWQNLLFATTMSIVPIITYSTAAVIIKNKFGASLENANSIIITRINTSISNAVQNMGEVADLKTEADLANNKGKAISKKNKAVKKYAPKEPTGETAISKATDIDALLKSFSTSKN